MSAEASEGEPVADEIQTIEAEKATVTTDNELESAPQPEPEKPGRPMDPRVSLDSVIDVPLRVTVEIGKTKMLVREVLQLNKGSVIPLDRMSGDSTDILVNGRLIARGEVTVVDDSLAVRVIELIARDTVERSR